MYKKIFREEQRKEAADERKRRFLIKTAYKIALNSVIATALNARNTYTREENARA